MQNVLWLLKIVNNQRTKGSVSKPRAQNNRRELVEKDMTSDNCGGPSCQFLFKSNYHRDTRTCLRREAVLFCWVVGCGEFPRGVYPPQDCVYSRLGRNPRYLNRGLELHDFSGFLGLSRAFSGFLELSRAFSGCLRLSGFTRFVGCARFVMLAANNPMHDLSN